MINSRWGKVASVVASRPGGVTEIRVDIDGSPARAVNYDQVTGVVRVGDRVLLNTTAVDLRLGSGGFHFVMAVDRPQDPADEGETSGVSEPGHIMKLRYTPLQLKCLSAEEEESPLRERLVEIHDLEGMPVVVGSLHSALAPVILGLADTALRQVRTAYIMTDGAALPIAWSSTVAELKAKGLISFTVTAGQAFGGDYEAVNKHSALLAAKAAGAEVAVLTLGPGIVGTGTKYGHTGLEQGEVVDAVNLLGGRAVAVPRMSFADLRPRHQGISHHSQTALGEICHTSALVALPELPAELRTQVMEQIASCPGLGRHHYLEVPTGEVAQAAERRGLTLSSMGRGYSEDPYYFEAGWAAGVVAARILREDART